MNNVEIKNLSKTYNNGTAALEQVSLSVNGGVFGLLGHNGAGKTTLMKAVSTILKPSGGTISVCGFDTCQHGDEVRSRIGYLPQELVMYPSLSVFDFVTYMAAVKGIYSKEKVNEALQQVDMLKYAKRKIGKLSGGMKRRVGIAQALVGDPQVLIVDEPTVGLDPEERVRFRGVLSRYAKGGRTVILSTHIVEDVYQLCERLAVLRKGSVFFSGNAEELMKQVQGKVKIIHLNSERGLSDLQKQAVVLASTYENGRFAARVVDNNMSLPKGEPSMATLEDAYVYCMGGKGNG